MATHPISQPSGGDNQPIPPMAGSGPMSEESGKYVDSLSQQVGAGGNRSMTNAEASERVDELRDKRDMQRPGDGSGVDASSTPDAGNTVKDPAEWKTGDEPMTGAQHSYLQTLSEEAAVKFDPTLSKAAASKRIDELRAGNQRIRQSH